MKARDLDRLNDAWRLAPEQTGRRVGVYARQRGRTVAVMPTSRQLRRIVAEARRAGGAR